MYKKRLYNPFSGLQRRIFRGTTLLATDICYLQPLTTVICYNGLSCNVKNTSSSTDISAFKRKLRGDITQKALCRFSPYNGSL